MMCTIFLIFSLFFTSVEKLNAGANDNESDEEIKKPYILAEYKDEESPTGYRYEFPTCAIKSEENDDIKFSSSGDSFKILYFCYRMGIFDCVNAGAKKFMNEYCAFDKKPNCGVKGNYEYVMENVLDEAGDEMSCARSEDNAKLYRVGYDFQFIAGESYNKDIYRFCYNKDKEKTLYVEYKIISPYLLNNSEVNDKEYHKEIEMTSFDKKEFGDLERKKAFYLENKALGFNLLVPPQHMAFEWWKEPLFHIVNTQLLLAKFHTEMNLINNYIKSKAIEVFGEVFIIGGVFDRSEDTYDSYIWWKLIYNESREYAIAVFIHNQEISPDENEKRCAKGLRYSCFNYGWNDIMPSTIRNFGYCCRPAYLVKKFNLPPAEMFDLSDRKSLEKFAGKRKDCNASRTNDSQNEQTAKRQKIKDFSSTSDLTVVN
ncbi:uncharacterized protein LOC135847228 [Planococcus citri]|uniref:uncharacterized protein LOC135847228 n=1 Tax=Planococcus citri TaxID=170843 RepID=UPI0031F890F9